MDNQFSFARVYTLLYYLIVLPFSVLFIFALFLKYIFAGLGANEYFVFSTRSELSSYYQGQIFQIKSYLLCIPTFLLSTIFLTPKHYNLKRFLVINIVGAILLTLFLIWGFNNTLTRWDKLVNIAQGMEKITYDYYTGSFPAYSGYQCVSFDIEPSQKVEVRGLITERIKNTNSNLVFNYKVGQQTIYDVNLLDTIKNNLRGKVCY